jgi:hypothetical protein
MAKMLRLTDDEEEMLRLKCIELNKVIINKGFSPIRDSELAHEILKQTINNCYLMADGKIRVRND